MVDTLPAALPLAATPRGTPGLLLLPLLLRVEMLNPDMPGAPMVALL